MSSGGGFFNRAKETTGKVASQVAQRGHVAQRAAIERAKEAKGRTEEYGRKGFRTAAERSVDWALNRSGAQIRASLVDDEAPNFINATLQGAFDAIWPDVVHELRENVLLSVHETVEGYAPAWQVRAPLARGHACRFLRVPPTARVLFSRPCTLPSFSFCCVQAPAKVGGLRALRAWFLYSFQPFDKSGFQQMRWPSYWLLLLWSACPYYGAQGLFWLTSERCACRRAAPAGTRAHVHPRSCRLPAAVFLLMDRGDEYTLVNFILSFKALQFVTLGFAGLLVGAGTYHACLTADVHKVTCDTNGPGQQRDFFFQFGAFWLQSWLVWIAFLLLPWSARMAGTQKQAVDEVAASAGVDEAVQRPDELPTQRRAEAEAETTYRQDAGGYLRRMVAYDVLCFLLVCGWVGGYGQYASAFTLRSDVPHWQFRATCFFAKTAYGLLSFPFIAFVIPPLNAILTHAKPTAYDQAGNAVPLLNARQRQEKERVERGLPAREPKPPGMLSKVRANVAQTAAYTGTAIAGAGAVARERVTAVRAGRRGSGAAEGDHAVDVML